MPWSLTNYPAQILDRWSFKFRSVSVPAISTAGTPYQRAAWYGMPTIPPRIVLSTFYLYESVEAAEKGEPFGGSGFFIGIPMGETKGPGAAHYVYAISNWHTAVRDGASVVRVNLQGGGVDIFDLDPAEWHFKPGWHDLAVADVNVQGDKHEFVFISADMILTGERLAELHLGPGEDVFMVGRFVDHDGGATNVPAVRFGHISVMPQAIKQPTGAALPSYILDVHSRSGYSGSPVYVYRTLGSDLSLRTGALNPSRMFVGLLGVHWGQFPERWEIKQGAQVATDTATIEANANYIKGQSGMTLAIPSDAILELLNLPELKKHRDASYAGLQRKGLIPGQNSPVAETSATLTSPTHKEAFNSLVSAAAKKKSPAD